MHEDPPIDGLEAEVGRCAESNAALIKSSVSDEQGIAITVMVAAILLLQKAAHFDAWRPVELAAHQDNRFLHLPANPYLFFSLGAVGEFFKNRSYVVNARVKSRSCFTPAGSPATLAIEVEQAERAQKRGQHRSRSARYCAT